MPNDWYRKAIGLPECKLTGHGVTVAVIDTGILCDHWEFADVDDRDPKVLATYQVDAEGQLGERGSGAEPWPEDYANGIGYHATAVAGLLAGRHSGVASEARVVNFTLPRGTPDGCRPDGSMTMRASMLLRLLSSLRDHSPRVNIIAFALVLPLEDFNDVGRSQFAAAVEELAEKEITIVAAIGNYGEHTAPGIPAVLPNVLAIGSACEHLSVPDPCLCGRQLICEQEIPLAVAPAIDVCAPNAYSSNHLRVDGSSFSAAISAGALSMVYERMNKNKAFTTLKGREWVTDAIQRFCQACQPLDRVARNFQGFGLIQVNRI